MEGAPDPPVPHPPPLDGTLPSVVAENGGGLGATVFSPLPGQRNSSRSPMRGNASPSPGRQGSALPLPGKKSPASPPEEPPAKAIKADDADDAANARRRESCKSTDTASKPASHYGGLLEGIDGERQTAAQRAKFNDPAQP